MVLFGGRGSWLLVAEEAARGTVVASQPQVLGFYLAQKAWRSEKKVW